MRFENIELYLFNEYDNGFDYEVYATDELIGIANQIRQRYGNEDLVGIDYDNDVYYNYYLICDDLTKGTMALKFSVSHGEKDDFVIYDIELFPEEKEMLMWKIIKDLYMEATK